MFDNYKALLAKVDGKYSEIKAAHSTRINCRQGCYTCCAPRLSLCAVEAASIKQFLEQNPELIEKIEEVNRVDPHGGKHCSFLDKDGSCLIYDARPIVCRSHGVPVLYRENRDDDKDEENDAPSKFFKSVCPLNYEGVPLESIDENHFINTELLNTLLSLINSNACPTRQDSRVVMTLKNILES